jgi:hypothetical protein
MNKNEKIRYILNDDKGKEIGSGRTKKDIATLVGCTLAHINTYINPAGEFKFKGDRYYLVDILDSYKKKSK